MTERERAVNQDLRVLDEAHRLGRITRGEYRARRRRVLESLHDSGGVTTARKSLIVPGATMAPRAGQAHTAFSGESSDAAGRALTTLLSMRPAMAWKPVLALLAGAVLLILIGWWLLFAG
jgi:hypothetical protein